MNMQEINGQCSPKEWLGILNKTFCSNQTHFQGHAYIYLNDKGQIDSFPSLNEAKKAAFKWKLPLADILELSKKYFPNYQECHSKELQTLRHAFEFMHKGIKESCKSCLKHWDNELKFDRTQQLIEEELQSLIKQEIQLKYQQLQETIQSFHSLVQELDDTHFDQIYEACLLNKEKYNQCFCQSHLTHYESLKNQKNQVKCLLNETQRLVYFTERILFIAKQKRIIYYLLLINPSAPIKKETIPNIEHDLNQLIKQRFLSSSSNEEDDHKQFESLDSELERCQFTILQDYENNGTCEPKVVQQITANEFDVKISPLNNFPSFCKKIQQAKSLPLIFKKNVEFFLMEDYFKNQNDYDCN